MELLSSYNYKQLNSVDRNAQERQEQRHGISNLPLTQNSAMCQKCNFHQKLKNNVEQHYDNKTEYLNGVFTKMHCEPVSFSHTSRKRNLVAGD